MDTNKFYELLKAGKLNEAKALLEEYFKQKPSEEEKAAVMVAVTDAYVRAKNEIDQAYIQELDEAERLLKEIKADEQKLEDQQKLDEARKNIG